MSASRQGLALVAERGLADREVRLRAVAALRALQRAGRRTAKADDRLALERHARYWWAIHRLVTGAWGEAPSIEVAAGDDSTSSPELRLDEPHEIVRRAATGVGLNSLVVRDVEILREHADGPLERFVVKNCRFIGVRVAGLAVERLSLESPGLIRTRFEQMHASTVEVTDGLLEDAHLDLEVDTDVLLRDCKVVGGALRLRATPCDGLSVVISGCAFESGEDGPATEVSCRAREARFTGDSNLAGVALVDCAFERSSFAGADLRGMRAQRTALGAADFTGAQADGVDLSGCTATEVVGLTGAARPPRRVS